MVAGLGLAHACAREGRLPTLDLHCLVGGTATGLVSAHRWHATRALLSALREGKASRAPNKASWTPQPGGRPTMQSVPAQWCVKRPCGSRGWRASTVQGSKQRVGKAASELGAQHNNCGPEVRRPLGMTALLANLHDNQPNDTNMRTTSRIDNANMYLLQQCNSSNRVLPQWPVWQIASIGFLQQVRM